jgi:type I restriction enzyme S subunit
MNSSCFPFVALKRLVKRKITDGPHVTPEFLDEGVPFLSVDSIQESRLVFENSRKISIDAHRDYSRKCKPRRGDLLIAKAASTGKVAMVDVEFEFSVWSPLALISPNLQQIDSRFLFYALISPEVQARIDLLCTFNTQRNISMGDLEQLQVPVPSLSRQRAIADFLDGETAKIKALITKNRQLTDLLAEQRFSTIHDLVTTGIAPSQLSDSGHEWIGCVPSHWSVVKTKFVARLATGHTPSREHPEYWVDCDTPWFSLADVWQLRSGRQEYLGDTSEKISQLGLANSAAVLLPAGTVIVSRTASVGFSGIMPVPMATTQDFVNWVCGPKIKPEYLL